MTDGPSIDVEDLLCEMIRGCEIVFIYLNIWQPQGASSDDESKSSLDPSISDSDSEGDSNTPKMLITYLIKKGLVS